MKLVGMVSWWDEGLSLLESCFWGMARLGVTHVVAVDGVLNLYPGGKPNSPSVTYEYLVHLSDKTKLELMLYRNQDRWEGNEVGKRQFMLELALTLTTDDDWLVIWDTDYVLLNSTVREKVHGLLEETELNYGDVSYGESKDHLYKARLLMRARRGLHLTTNHYIYHGPEGDQSWMLGTGDEAQALQMRFIKVYHNRLLRPPDRNAGRAVFYERRDQMRIEYR